MDLNTQFNNSNNIIAHNSNNASWQPESAINNKIQVDAGLTTNWKYRQYMQNNAQDIMKYNTMETFQASGNNPYIIQDNVQTENSPYLFNSVHDVNNSPIDVNNSDLKRDYMKQEQMKARMVAPSISLNLK
jgi:hypothetical protein